MGKNKVYRGYKSWSFLEEGKDYRKFRLAKEIGRVPSKAIPLSKAEEERFESFLENNIVVSVHDHSLVYPEDPGEFMEYARTGRPFIGYEGLSASGLDAVFENMMDGETYTYSPDSWSWENQVFQIGMIQSDVDHQDMVFIGRRVEDIERAHNEGKIAMILSLESAPSIGDDIAKIDALYGLGVRVMGVVYG
ncbi:MAG: membrane dipeptidase, partial [Fervidicoccus fontis]